MPKKPSLKAGKASVHRTALRVLFAKSSPHTQTLAASAARLTRERKRQEWQAARADAGGVADFDTN